jgi:hypothetical protein
MRVAFIRKRELQSEAELFGMSLDCQPFFRLGPSLQRAKARGYLSEVQNRRHFHFALRTRWL